MKEPMPLELQARGFCARLNLDPEAKWVVIAAGIAAVAETFRVSPSGLKLDTVFFEDLKPSFWQDIDGVGILLLVEEKVGGFADVAAADSVGKHYWLKLGDCAAAESATKLYRVKLGDWLVHLAAATWC